MDDIRPPAPPRPKPSSQPSRPASDHLLSPPSPQKKLEIKKKSKLWIWILCALAIILVVTGALAAYTWAWYNTSLNPVSSSEDRTRFQVNPGETPTEISHNLHNQGLIRNPTAFQWYVTKNKVNNSLQAGTYLISPSQSVPQIVELLVGGKVDSYNLTILPGKSLEEIKQDLIKVGFDAAAIDQAMTKQYDHPLLKDKPANVNLEGYIFPDTYNITSQTTPQQLFELTFDIFYQRIQAKNLQDSLAQRGFNLHQGITMASLVQLEVSTEEDRRQVAQVFERRLQIGMPLGSDVTYLYAAKLLGVPARINLDSPYNTRINTGLPPGAISNFNLASLEAVANPAPGDYLYFVAGDDGTTHFATTEAGHQENIDKYCTVLCATE